MSEDEKKHDHKHTHRNAARGSIEEIRAEIEYSRKRAGELRKYLSERPESTIGNPVADLVSVMTEAEIQRCECAADNGRLLIEVIELGLACLPAEDSPAVDAVSAALQPRGMS